METTALRKLQLIEIEILDEVVRICEKYNITYYLIYGTLLGAIRHKGFIPWDDDIDIAMPREDYNKFKEICKKELNSEYFLQSYETDPLYWNSHVKIRKNGTLFEESSIVNLDTHKGIFVDIFILDNASSEKSILQEMQAAAYKLFKYMIAQKVQIIPGEESKFKQKLLKIIFTPLILLISQNQLQSILQSITTINKDPKSKYYVSFGSVYGYRKVTISKEKYYPPARVEFEGKVYNAPRDWDYYLKRIYGDYMQLPAEEKRVSQHGLMRIRFGDNT